MRNRLVAALMFATLALGIGACSSGFQGQETITDTLVESDSAVTGAEASISPFNWDVSKYAGISGLRIVRNGTVAEAVIGREHDEIKLSYDPSTGLFEFEARGARAFEGQIAQAELRARIAEAYGTTWVELAPEIKGAVESALTAVCAIAGVACPSAT